MFRRGPIVLETLDGVGDWALAFVRLVVDLLHGRWVLPIMRSLRAGPLRRSVLVRAGPVADKVLTAPLRRTRSQQLVLRIAIPSVPVEGHHGLTARALSLEPVPVSIDSCARKIIGGG